MADETDQLERHPVFQQAKQKLVSMWELRQKSLYIGHLIYN